jgi:hypothetical protein
MSYVGTPLIFQFDNISRNLGCYESNSVAQWKGITYFLADDGFYACDGQNLEAIGAEKVNRFFWDSVREEVISQMSTAVDPFRSLVIWGYPTDEGYQLLVYHTQTKRWSYVETDVARISDVFTPGTSLEALDNFSTSIDALPASLDSRQWLGGKLLLSGVRGAKIINFVGSNKQARITTPDVQGGENGHSCQTDHRRWLCKYGRGFPHEPVSSCCIWYNKCGRRGESCGISVSRSVSQDSC